MNIAVIGGTGFIGSKVVTILRHRGQESWRLRPIFDSAWEESPTGSVRGFGNGSVPVRVSR